MRFIGMAAVAATAFTGLCLFGGGCSVHSTSYGFSDGGFGEGGFNLNPEAGASSSDGGTKKDGSTTTKPKSDGTACGDFCANAAAKVDCDKSSSCQSDCEDQSSQVPSKCQDAWNAVLECGKTASFDGCDSKGKPKMTGCDTETSDLLTCLQGGTTNPPPDDGGTSANCGGLGTGNATCDACLTTNCCSQESACAGDSKCMAIINCVANCTDTTCETACKNANSAGAAHYTALTACFDQQCGTACQP